MPDTVQHLQSDADLQLDGPDAAMLSEDPLAHTNWKPRFFMIWAGQALSLIGSALTQFVLLWWITQTTGSVAALATAGMMALLPLALFSPLGGILADRYSRRGIMIATDIITALCMVVLIVLFSTGKQQLWHVYTLMFVRSSMQAFQGPAASASIPMLVPKDWLSRAAGLNQTIQGLMTIAAAPLGAVALAWFPLQGALMIDVVTAGFGIAPLLIFRIPQRFAPRHAKKSLWSEFHIGLNVVRGHRGLTILYGVQTLMVLTIMPTFTLTPLLVKQHFGGGVSEVAYMEGFAGIGMLCGGALVSVLPGFRRRIVGVMVSFALSCASVAFAAGSPGQFLWLAVFWWFVSGATYSVGNAPLMAIVQSVVPNQLQGRVLSLLMTLVGIAGPLGLALVAPLGSAIGVRALFVVSGCLAALVCLTGLFSKSLMRIEETPIVLPAHDRHFEEK